MVVANNVMLICKVRTKGQRIIARLGPAAVWKRMVASEFQAEHNYGSQSKY